MFVDVFTPGLEETYPSPPHGWTCFHCGETFTNPNKARDHFGHDIDATPACQLTRDHVSGELRRFRVIEAKLRSCLDEFISIREDLDYGANPKVDAERAYRIVQKTIEAIE